MYQPALRPDQITRLYSLKLHRRKPMTRLLREAVDQYLHANAEELEQLVKETEANQSIGVPPDCQPSLLACDCLLFLAVLVRMTLTVRAVGGEAQAP